MRLTKNRSEQISINVQEIALWNRAMNDWTCAAEQQRFSWKQSETENKPKVILHWVRERHRESLHSYVAQVRYAVFGCRNNFETI